MKVFIDLGAHKGRTIKKFVHSQEYSKDFVIHAFEPNENVDVKYPKKAIVHKQLAWICNGLKVIYTSSERITHKGTSIHKQAIREERVSQKVNCIDFNDWIKNNFKKTDYIILKMSIGGAEYPVLGRMINTGVIEYINKLYVKFYADKLGLDLDYDRKLRMQLNEIKGLEVGGDYIHL